MTINLNGFYLAVIVILAFLSTYFGVALRISRNALLDRDRLYLDLYKSDTTHRQVLSALKILFENDVFVGKQDLEKFFHQALSVAARDIEQADKRLNKLNLEGLTSVELKEEEREKLSDSHETAGLLQNYQRAFGKDVSVAHGRFGLLLDAIREVSKWRELPVPSPYYNNYLKKPLPSEPAA
jgi:hypothetical protein